METYIIYLLKVALSLAVLYGFYRLLLNGETFHRTNRTALIGIMLLCWIFPLIELHINEPNLVQQTWTEVESSMIEQPESTVIATTDGARHWLLGDLIFGIYLLGVSYKLILLGRSWMKISKVLKQGYASTVEGRKVVIGKLSCESFSFGNTIYMQSDDYAHHFESVFAHEDAHIRYRHTLDLLLVELTIALQWFNPAIYFLKKRLIELHEYQADQSVINQGFDAKTYQRLLIQKSIVRGNITLANSLNQSSIKKRITMMLKKKSSFWASLKFVGIIPAALICVSLFAKPIEETALNVNQEINDPASTESIITVKEHGKQETKKTTDYDFQKKESKKSKTNLSEVTIAPYGQKSKDDQGKTQNEKSKANESSKDEDNPTFTVVETMPQFPGGVDELMKFLSKNVKYPEEAIEKGIQGKVICEFTITKDGSITDVKVGRSIDPLLDAEAIRVIKLMPKWTPGKQRGKEVNVRYLFPVSFSTKK